MAVVAWHEAPTSSTGLCQRSQARENHRYNRIAGHMNRLLSLVATEISAFQSKGDDNSMAYNGPK